MGAAPLFLFAAAALLLASTVGLPEFGGAVADAAPDDGAGAAPDLFGALAAEMAGVLGMAGGAGGAGVLSPAGLAALKQREGFSATPYADYKGRSIGYGHLMGLFESYTSITREKAEELLAQDVEWAVAAVNDAVRVPLTQFQFDALVSFAYNVGAGAFKRSTLVRKINAGDPTAAGEFARWNIAGGSVHAGLVNRRASEAAQFEGQA